MKMQLIIIATAVLFLNTCTTTTSSSDEDIKPSQQIIPEATMEGLHTFGCYINGEVWVAETPLGSSIAGIDDLIGNYLSFVPLSQRENYFEIEAIRIIKDDDIHQEISIAIDQVTGVGTYNLLYQDHFPSPPYRDINYNCQRKLFYLDTLKTNQITITRFDTISQIVSGTFEMTLYNEICEDTLKVTGGRFDVVY